MFELILKWPTVSHTVQTVSQRLRRLLRSFVIPLAVAALVFFGLGLYWSGCSFTFFMLMANKQRDTSFLCPRGSH